MINILHLITSTEQNKGVGGAETLLLAMLNRIDRSRFRFTVAYGAKGVLYEDLKRGGANVVPLNTSMHFDIPAILRIRRIIKDNNIDIVHSHQPRLDLFGAISAKAAHKPMILTRHLAISESPIPSLKIYAFVEIDKFTLKNTDNIICASRSIADDLVTNEKANRNKIQIIYAGLDLKIYDAAAERGRIRKEFSIPIEAPLVGMVGRINAQKAHQYFLMAASEVLKEEPQAKFMIIGDGPLRDAQEKLAKSLSISSSVIFAGFRSDIPEIVGDLDISALSSLTEALAVVNMEAMAMKKPVVSFDVGGVSELVIDKETGFLIPPKDWRLFAKAIIILIKDKQMAHQMGTAGRKRIEDNFTLDAMVRKHEQLYANILTSRAKMGKK